MKASELGKCAECYIDDGGFVHICGLDEGHKDNHDCVAGCGWK